MVRDKKFTCSHTESQSLSANALPPWATEEVVKYLNEVKFISVLADISNHIDFKLIYHLPHKGVQVKVLKFTNIRPEYVRQIQPISYCDMTPESRNSEIRIDVYC
jgi:hypothetical protein